MFGKTKKGTKRFFGQAKAASDAKAQDQKDVSAFMEEYGALVRKHKLDFEFFLRTDESGIRAASRIIRVTPVQEPKDGTESPQS